jgi:hypothetical protein
MTDEHRKQIAAWADGIEQKTLDPYVIPPPARDAVQIELLERHKRMHQAAARKALAPAS